jgi:hypothetical protein
MKIPDRTPLKLLRLSLLPTLGLFLLGGVLTLFALSSKLLGTFLLLGLGLFAGMCLMRYLHSNSP